MGLPFHQHLFPPVKKIVGEYDMIREGDKIAVGVSGGKDSLATLYTLAHLRYIIPVRYSLHAIAVDMGWPHTDWSRVEEYCQSLAVPFTVVPSQLAEILFDIRKETNPCSLCSKLRHGILNSSAKEAGCNVVALGHTSNDAIETVFLNMFYAGRIACFKPVSILDRSNLRLIRPMLYVSENTTRRVAEKLQLPLIANPCPANGSSKRQAIKEMLERHTQGDKLAHNRLLAAVKGLWKSQSHQLL
ncbi:MAG: tRNA 2-thiocytidine biosynthesis TtcA family protein [Bacillota bacterium]|mgnify:CR=1 FL=1|jgi:tRNA 2-thiocytidine biosynthesis protein TtcA|nr:tRNA 2-thiocytidine biosynthesis protein TtcA [Bacillota bacterium]